MRNFLSILCCSAFYLSSSAQTPELDLQKVLRPLTDAKYLYFENQYLYFEGDATEPSETLNGLFHRNGEQAFVKMGMTEVLKMKDIIVAADHEGRMVSAQNEAESSAINTLVDGEKVRELIESRSAKTAYTFGKGTWNAISVTDLENPDEKMIIQYNPSNWFIQEVTITTKDPEVPPWDSRINKVTVVIRYLNYTIFPKSFPYLPDDYVRKKGKRYVSVGKCKGYTVI